VRAAWATAVVPLLLACAAPAPVTDTSTWVVPTPPPPTTTQTQTNTLGWPPPGDVVGRFELAADENTFGQATTDGRPSVAFFTATEASVDNPIQKVGDCGIAWEQRITPTTHHSAGAVSLSDGVDDWPATLDTDPATYSWPDPLWVALEDSRLGTPYRLTAEGSAEIPSLDLEMGMLPTNMPMLLSPGFGRALDVDDVHLAWQGGSGDPIRIDILAQPDITEEPIPAFSCLVDDTGSHQVPVSAFHEAFGTAGKVTVEIAVVRADERFHELEPDRYFATALQARGFANQIEITLDPAR